MMDRKRGFLASVVVLSLIGCSTAANLASPTTTPVQVEASPMPSITGAAPNPTTPPSLTPAAPASNGGADLVVWQMNGTHADNTTKSSVFAIDIGSGEKRQLATIPETDETCCPSLVDVSTDRETAFLLSTRPRGRIDLGTGAFTKWPVGVPRVDIALSHDGKHVAWVDLVTGSKPTVIVSDSNGKERVRLDLPPDTWFSRLAWSEDDRALLATASIKLKKAVGTIILIETERGDPGPLATHLVTVPLDGSPGIDLVDDAAAVAADLKAPASPPPSINLPKGTNPDRILIQPRWSPDGSMVAYVEKACWTEGKSYHDRKTACLSRLLTVDVTTRVVRVVVDEMAGISTLTWAPNGREIAFQGDDRSGHVGIFVDDIASGAARFLEPAGPEDFEFLDDVGTVQWSPDGTWIAYRRDNASWVVRADGSDAREIAPHAVAGW